MKQSEFSYIHVNLANKMIYDLRKKSTCS